MENNIQETLLQFDSSSASMVGHPAVYLGVPGWQNGFGSAA